MELFVELVLGVYPETFLQRRFSHDPVISTANATIARKGRLLSLSVGVHHSADVEWGSLPDLDMVQLFQYSQTTVLCRKPSSVSLMTQSLNALPLPNLFW